MSKKGLILQIKKSKDHYLKEKNKKVIGLMKYELCGKIMAEFAALKPKTYSYLTNDSDKNKKAKGIKKCHKKKT